ncbi:MAG: ribosome-associated translation inhibitor RaiA [Pseudomonadota bacterium]
MHIQINGKQIDVGEALSQHVEDSLSAAIAKYFDRPVDATVTFSRDAHAFRCDAHVHLPTGLTAQSSARANDVYAAFDQGAERIEKQLRRYKRRLKDHHQTRAKPVDVFDAQAYVLEAVDVKEETEEPDSLQPVIVAEMTQSIQALSVGEAVMQMELADKPFLIFRNEANDGVNIVFRRDDGNIGWVDPANLSKN